MGNSRQSRLHIVVDNYWHRFNNERSNLRFIGFFRVYSGSLALRLSMVRGRGVRNF
jgi:hypothetical protein